MILVCIISAGGTVLDHSISVTSEEALEGQDFKLQCSFLLDPPTAQFSLIWSLNSQPLKNSKRIQITEPAQQGRLVSSLMFSPIYYKDSGQFVNILKKFKVMVF